MNKLLLGIIIGLGLTAVGVASARYTGQSWRLPRENEVYKLRDGSIVCYVSDGFRAGGISCLVEPR